MAPIPDRDDAAPRLRALLAEQASLHRVARLVASDPHPQAVFDAVSEEVGLVLGVEATNLVRLHSSHSAEVVGAWTTSRAPAVAVGSVVPLDGDAALVRVARSGRAARVDDYTELDGELAARLRSVGIRSSVAAPIGVAGGLWGAVLASSGRPHSFSGDAETRIAEFAELVAHALAAAEAREHLAASRARIVAAADAERRRLERNLHDGAQQRLVGLALSLRAARERLDVDLAGARRVLSGAERELEAALAELRELARGLHPAILTERGLRSALEGLARRAPLAVDVEAAPSSRLPERIEVAIYYLVAEALANVAKHARASGASVEVGTEGERAVARVADDGVGGAQAAGGSGLRGLCDRVEALGGRLEIDSPPGEGTILRAQIPLVGDPPLGRPAEAIPPAVGAGRFG